LVRLNDKEFDRIVKRAIRRIPGEIREHLENILITVQKRPSKELLADMDLPEDEDLLGLFSGDSTLEQSVAEPSLYPATIYLFQEPLEEMCKTKEELEEEIELTVVHEIAHAIGMSEERLTELGYE
jgi:predicted Zn-dependent protease with MMP-like domain